PPPGTFADLRLVLIRNMHWQDCTTGCQPVTAWDVKYTLINLEAAAPYLAGLGGLSNLNGVQVLNLYTLDLNLKSFSYLDTELALNLITMIPGHVWTACGAATWNGNLAAAAPTIGDNLSRDPLMLYVETGSDTHWDPGESVIMDYDNNGIYSGGDTVIYGTIPAFGTALSADPLVSFDNPSFPAFARQSWTGQTVIYDNAAIGTYAAGDTIIRQKSGLGGSNISGTTRVAPPE